MNERFILYKIKSKAQKANYELTKKTHQHISGSLNILQVSHSLAAVIHYSGPFCVQSSMTHIRKAHH